MSRNRTCRKDLEEGRNRERTGRLEEDHSINIFFFFLQFLLFAKRYRVHGQFCAQRERREVIIFDFFLPARKFHARVSRRTMHTSTNRERTSAISRTVENNKRRDGVRGYRSGLITRTTFTVCFFNYTPEDEFT